MWRPSEPSIWDPHRQKPTTLSGDRDEKRKRERKREKGARTVRRALRLEHRTHSVDRHDGGDGTDGTWVVFLRGHATITTIVKTTTTTTTNTSCSISSESSSISSLGLFTVVDISGKQTRSRFGVYLRLAWGGGGFGWGWAYVLYTVCTVYCLAPPFPGTSRRWTSATLFQPSCWPVWFGCLPPVFVGAGLEPSGPSACRRDRSSGRVPGKRSGRDSFSREGDGAYA